jgi:hypothetical protein
MLVSFLRVLHGLPGQLVSAQVIAFFVMGGGSPVGMRGKFVEFGSSSMGIARHTFILAPHSRPRADAWGYNPSVSAGGFACILLTGRYAVRIASDLSPEMAACAAANLAIGTR